MLNAKPQVTVMPVRTPIFKAGEDLTRFVVESTPKELIREKMVLAVTSKIVSLAEGRLTPFHGENKRSLVERESDLFLGEGGHGCFLTVKHGLLIPSAGIDESNSVTGDYILYPLDPFASAFRLWQDLRTHWKLQDLGILITDSHTTPLRRGVIGISLSHWGFEPLRRLVGTEDLFGRPLKMTNMNLADGMAVMAVMTMGEGRECQPLAVLHGTDLEFTTEDTRADLSISPAEDLYAPFFRGFGL